MTRRHVKLALHARNSAILILRSCESRIHKIVDGCSRGRMRGARSGPMVKMAAAVICLCGMLSGCAAVRDVTSRTPLLSPFLDAVNGYRLVNSAFKDDSMTEAGPVMITLADLPELTAGRVGSLWRRFCEDGAQDILIPRHQGQAGHPRCFGKAHVAALIAQGDAVDVPAYLAAHSQSVRFWDVDDPAVIRDIDTPAAYAALCRRLAHDA